MEPLELAWLAGYLEGEGCFRMGIGGVRTGSTRLLGPTGTPTIKVAATDHDVVLKAAVLMGCDAKNANRQTVAGKPVFTAEICGDRALALMRLLLPHMCQRRRAKILEVISIAAQRPGHLRGDQYRNSKLNRAKVLEIRESAKAGRSQVSLASEFGVSQALISLVVTRQNWAHVE